MTTDIVPHSVCRGGGQKSHPRLLRSADRCWYDLAEQYIGLGFRMTVQLGRHRVIRGASWYDPAMKVRSNCRNTFHSGYVYRHLGFRLGVQP